jgi:hypothetical protein
VLAGVVMVATVAAITEFELARLLRAGLRP